MGFPNLSVVWTYGVLGLHAPYDYVQVPAKVDNEGLPGHLPVSE